MPLMAFRLVRPRIVVDLRKISRLEDLHVDDDGVTIGAMVTHRTVERDTTLTSRYGLLADALPLIGHVAIRNVGTVGGSLAHADPAAEWPTAAVALGAELLVHGRAGTRIVPADEFFTGWMETTLNERDILGGVRFPPPGPGTGSAFVEVARRHGDFAIVGAAAVVSVEDGVVTDARIVLSGAATRPLRATEAEQAMIGKPATEAVLDDAGAAAGAAAVPVPDIHATVEYKRHLSSVVTRRAVRRAYARAGNAA